MFVGNLFHHCFTIVWVLVALNNSYFLGHAATSKQKDIYEVLTDEATPPARSLDPVYYVGIYDEKPSQINYDYEVEIMTSKIGKRFTCLLPKSGAKDTSNEKNKNSKKQSSLDVDDNGNSNTNNNKDNENNNESQKNKDQSNTKNTNANSDNEDEIENDNEQENDDDETDDNQTDNTLRLTAAELVEKHDTLTNRENLLREMIKESPNSHPSKSKNDNNKKNSKQSRSSNKNKGGKTDFRKQLPPQVTDGSVCHRAKVDYWSYEACLFETVEQYNNEKPEKRTMKFNLGYFNTILDVSLLKQVHSTAIENYQTAGINNNNDNSNNNNNQKGNKKQSGQIINYSNYDESIYEYAYILNSYDISIFTNDYSKNGGNNKNIVSNQNGKDAFLHLLYDNGDGKRSTIVSIYCLDDLALNGQTQSQTQRGKRSYKSPREGIFSVMEPKTHFYHIMMGLEAVCDYHDWIIDKYDIDTSDGTIEQQQQQQHQQQQLGQQPHGLLSNVQHQFLAALTEPIAGTNDVSVLLSPFLEAHKNQENCLLLNQGWWTVEFCYGHYVRQIHLENKTQQKDKKTVIVATEVTQEHVMGRWNSNVNKITKDSFTIFKDENHPQRTYAEIIYKNGDSCDITGEARSTRIQFRCAVNEKITSILSSREDPSCHYIVEIETPLLCNHESFIIPKAPHYEIVCYPYNDKELWMYDAVTVKQDSNDDGSSIHSMKSIVDKQIENDDFLKLLRDASILKNDEKNDIDAKQFGLNENDYLKELKPWLEKIGYQMPFDNSDDNNDDNDDEKDNTHKKTLDSEKQEI